MSSLYGLPPSSCNLIYNDKVDDESYFSRSLDDNYCEDESDFALNFGDPINDGYSDDEVDDHVCDDYIDVRLTLLLVLLSLLL